MASQAPGPPPNFPTVPVLMAAHDSNNCPAALSKRNARIEARQVFNVTQTIPKDQVGRTPWLNLPMENIPSSAECMLPDADITTDFTNSESAQEYRKLLLTRSSQYDETIPRTQTQRRAHVSALIKAFKCVPQECEDRDDMKKWFVEERHHNQLVEAKCWEILDETITRSMRTTNLVEAHEPNKFKFKAGTMTFAERFDVIKETMAISKTICKHLFDVSFVLKFVDDPAHNRARVESNRILNGKKAEIMKRGKQEQEKERNSKRPRLDRDTSYELQSDEDADDFDSDIPVKNEDLDFGPRLPRSARGPTLRQTSVTPIGSMSAPQMRTNMAPPTTPGATFMRNTAYGFDQSPLAGYSSGLGTTMNNTMAFGNNNQFLNTPVLQQQGLYQSQARRQSVAPLSSPFSMGSSYPAQTPAHQIMRPDSAMSFSSQHTLFQPQNDPNDPWNPSTPPPGSLNGGSNLGQNSFDTAMNSDLSMTPMDPATQVTPRFVGSNTNSAAPYNRYAGLQPHYTRQAERLGLQPSAIPIPEEVTSDNLTAEKLGIPIPEDDTSAPEDTTGEDQGSYSE